MAHFGALGLKMGLCFAHFWDILVKMNQNGHFLGDLSALLDLHGPQIVP